MEISKSIDERLNDIFSKRFNIPHDFWNTENREQHFLGEKIGLIHTELVYLFFDVEKEFNIRLSERAIINEGFYSYNNVLKIIKSQLRLVS